jgi:hypothetical protein
MGSNLSGAKLNRAFQLEQAGINLEKTYLLDKKIFKQMLMMKYGDKLRYYLRKRQSEAN